MCFLYIWGQHPHRRGEQSFPEKNFLTVGIFRKNISKYSKLKLGPCSCDDLKKTFFLKQTKFFIFNKKILKVIKKSLRKSSGRLWIVLFRTFMITLC